MLPTSLALAWPLWRRHRWGLLLALGYLTCVVIVVAALPLASLGPLTVTKILTPLVMPLIAVPTYLITVFSFGNDVDVNMPESCFPRSLYRLPVPTRALFAWHAAYGALAAFLLWFITAWFILGPWLALWDAAVPLWWPAMLGVAAQAWFQAVLWSPVGLPGIRIFLIAVIVPAEIAAAESCVMAGYSERLLVLLLSFVAVTGWIVGYAGTVRGRRGDVPHWNLGLSWMRHLVFWRSRRREPIANAARAQVWFEWRRTGLALPVLTGVLLPAALLPLLLGPNDVIPTWRTVLGTLSMPVLLAGLAGTTVSAKNPWVKDYYGVSPFTASLPMSTAAMVSAKLKAAAISTLVTWILVIVSVFAMLVATWTIGEMTEWWRRGLEHFSPAQIVTVIIAAAVMLVVWTWKRMVNSLFLGLTGRKWFIQGSIYFGMLTIAGVVAIASWIRKDPNIYENALQAAPWILGIFVCCRLALTIWAVRWLRVKNLVAARTIGCGVLAWLLLGGALFSMLAWALPGELVPRYYLAFAVILILPLARLAATPLALAWNRHR